MESPWRREGGVLPPADDGGPDSVRAWEPWVLEEPDGTLRMWYAGHDRTTARIVEAVQAPGERWRRLATTVDPGLAGASDGYGVGSPCVVKAGEGYLLAYAGFDGRLSRLHLAASPDGRRWTSQGPILDAEAGAGLAGGTPCLVVDGDQWWLYYSSSEWFPDGRRTAILAAVSTGGATWDPVGPVLVPESGEAEVSHPCVVQIAGRRYLFFASESGQRGLMGQGSIALATSTNGVDWTRRGIVVSSSGGDPDAAGVNSPCALRLRDGSFRLWYSRRPWGDDQLAYSVCAASFPGPW